MHESGPAERTVGKFAWDTSRDRWQWDDEMFALHGYPAGAVAVSLDLVLQHKHDEHRARAADLVKASAAGDRRFSNFHAIVDARGRRRTTLSVGESRVEPTAAGPRRVVHGFMVDVTPDERDSTTRALRRAREGVAPIQQSIGLLRGSLGLTEEGAFALVSRISQRHNVKVRALAERFLTAAVATAAETPRDLAQVLLTQAASLAVERSRAADD